jgi:hypothetical protein
MNQNIGIEFVEEQWGKRTLTFVQLTVLGIPSLVCDIWCYEDKFGIGEPYPQDDGSLILKHRHGDNPLIELTTHLIPSEDTVESVVKLTGPDESAVCSVGTVNACWQFRNSEGFGNRGHFVKDFVNRCFIYTNRGFTRMTETERFPDTRKPPSHEYNSPPWVQNYYPVWEKHPGQPEAGWGVSTDRPVYSLVGCISREGKHLAAWGCYQCLHIGQGWHDCLHLYPDFQFDYDATTNQIVSHSKFYFMENNPDRLLTRYKQDFAPVEQINR